MEGCQDAWDRAEEASFLAGYKFIDRNGNWQHEESNKSYVAQILDNMLKLHPDKPRAA